MVRCSCGTFIRLFTSDSTSPLLASDPATRVMAGGAGVQGGRGRGQGQGCVGSGGCRLLDNNSSHAPPTAQLPSQSKSGAAGPQRRPPASPRRGARTQLLGHLVGQREEGGLVHGQLGHGAPHVDHLLGNDLRRGRRGGAQQRHGWVQGRQQDARPCRGPPLPAGGQQLQARQRPQRLYAGRQGGRAGAPWRTPGRCAWPPL